MRTVRSRVKRAASLLGQGRLPEFRDKLLQALWSEHRVVCLRRDLEQTLDAPPTPVQITVRPLEDRDLETLFAPSPVPGDADIQAERRGWIESGLPGCHVAVVDGTTPCFMQWLLRAEDNDRIRDIFGGFLPVLDDDTVQLEGAYTPPRFRRLPVMPAAMSEIALLGRSAGARRAQVFIGEENASMIKAARMAGFVPYAIRTERRRLLGRSMHFSEPPPA
jgi:hypothetical protein